MRKEKIVFLLGAGASAASSFNLPTMSNLIEPDFFSTFPKLKEFALKYFPSSKLSEIDIEELFSYLDFFDQNQSSFGESPNPDIWHVKNELHIYLQKRLAPQAQEKECKKFTRLFSGHTDEKCKDSIITLNYDSIVDESLFFLAAKTQHGDLHGNSILRRTYELTKQERLWGGTAFSVKPAPSYYLALPVF